MRKSVVANRLIGVAAVFAAALLLVGAPGCAGKKKPAPTPVAAPHAEATPPTLSLNVEATPPQPPAPPPPAPPPPPPAPAPPCTVLRDAIAGMRVHFDVDRSAPNPAGAAELDQIAGSIRDSKLGPGLDLSIEGHCDSTGTEGYNVALGERRAAAIRKRLIDLGVVNPAHVKTVTWGEQRPIDPAETPAAYAQNRRVEFVANCPAN